VTAVTTIHIMLADGTTDGLKVVLKDNWSGQALMFAKSEYRSARRRLEGAGAGVYVLFGQYEGDSLEYRLYVGESDQIGRRLAGHVRQDDDFWTKAIAFTGAGLNKAHIRYLEGRLLRLARQAERCEIKNVGAGSPAPSLSEMDRASADAFLADMLTIYPLLGLRAFERLEGTTEGARLSLAPGGATAEGAEVADGFVVFANAVARKEVSDWVQEKGRDLIDQRRQMLEDGVLLEEPDGYRLARDHLFSSPSRAATVLLGTPTNGREAWRGSDGRTLKQLQEADANAVT